MSDVDAESPSILLTGIALDFRRLLFDVVGFTEVSMICVDRDMQDTLMEVLSRMLTFSEEVMDESFPDRASDRDLLRLSYQLPMPLALALLRKRMIRGIALRDMHRAALNPTKEM